MSNMSRVLYLLIFWVTNAENLENFPCTKDQHYFEICEKVFIWDESKHKYTSILQRKAMNIFGRHETNLRILVQSERPKVWTNLCCKLMMLKMFCALERMLQKLNYKIIPYIYGNGNNTCEVKGFIGDIWKVLQDMLKLRSCELHSVPYDRGIEILQKNEADIFLAVGVPLSYHVNIRHLQPYYINWYNLYLKTPKRMASSNSYVTTLSPKLWISSGILFAILTTSLWLTIKFLNKAVPLEPNVSLFSCFLGTVGGFINQGFDLKLRSISGRIIILSALFCGVVLYSAVTAVLFVRLTMSNIVYPFNHLHDIADHRTHSICVRRESFVYNDFTDKNHQLLPKWKNIVNSKHCLNISDPTNIPKIICNEGVIIFENYVVMSTVLNSNKIPCDVSSFPTKFNKAGNNFIVRKGHTIGEMIESCITRLRSSGILNRIKNKWILNKQKESATWNSCTMGHIQGVLVAYAGMMMLSLIMLGVEIWWKRDMDRWRRRFFKK